jgi:ketosteroid isomerase-like protein
LLSAEDRWAIGETLSLHGHLFDEGELDRLDELFTPDVVYDVTEVGVGELHGIEEIRDAALELGADNPVGHHVTNIVIESGEGDRATARSKGIVVTASGKCGSATFVDTLRREGGRWRIKHRIIHPRRTPLNGAHIADPDVT